MKLPAPPVLAASLLALNSVAFAEEVEFRLELENGATVLLLPRAECSEVAVVALFDAGILDEPSGMTQVAQLTQRLVDQGAIEDFEAGAAAARLDELGLVAAETLPYWIHFDAVVPRAALGEVLAIEAARLTSLTFDEYAVRAQAGPCYAATDAAEARQGTAMPSQALAAYHQAWRHGAERALVRGGLEALELDAIRAFHRSAFRPERLTLVIAGGFVPSEAAEAVRAALGELPGGEPPAPLPSVDWEGLPERRVVTWDASRTAVSLAWPPPATASERRLVSWLAPLVRQRLANDPEVRPLVEVIESPTYQWQVGELPLYFHALLRPGVDPEEAEAALRGAAGRFVEGDMPKGIPGYLALRTENVIKRATRTWEDLEDDATFSARMNRADPTETLRQMLAQLALDRAVAERVLGADLEESVEELTELEREELADFLRSALAPRRCRATWLVPAE